MDQPNSPNEGNSSQDERADNDGATEKSCETKVGNNATATTTTITTDATHANIERPRPGPRPANPAVVTSTRASLTRMEVFDDASIKASVEHFKNSAINLGVVWTEDLQKKETKLGMYIMHVCVGSNNTPQEFSEIIKASRSLKKLDTFLGQACRLMKIEGEESNDDGKTITIGTRVTARWKTGGTWQNGVAVKLNFDGTVNVKFDDGKSRSSTPMTDITVLDGSLLLRFVLGSRVKCWTKGGRDGEAKIWEHGVIVQHYYREEHWPKHKLEVPYQILLDRGQEIMASLDDDSMIQKTEWDSSVLRFPIGTRVQCNFVSDPQMIWPSGTVIEHFYRCEEENWPPERVACYYVQLDYGSKIWAWNDEDTAIKRSSETITHVTEALSKLLFGPRMPTVCWEMIWNYFSFNSFTSSQGPHDTPPELELRLLCLTFSQSIPKPHSVNVCASTQIHNDAGNGMGYIPVCGGAWNRTSIAEAVTLVRSMQKKIVGSMASIPMKILIPSGTHSINEESENLSLLVEDVRNITFVGQGRVVTQLDGCLKFSGKNTTVAFQNITLSNRCRDPETGHALHISNGASVTIQNSEVINCKGTGAIMLMDDGSSLSMDACRILYHRQNGIVTTGAVVCQLTDCEIDHCKGAAIVAHPNAEIDIYGAGTNIHHNYFATYIYGSTKPASANGTTTPAKKAAQVQIHLPRDFVSFHHQQIADVEVKGNDGDLKFLDNELTPQELTGLIRTIQEKNEKAAALEARCAAKGYAKVPEDYRTIFEAVAAARKSNKRIQEVRLHSLNEKSRHLHVVHDCTIDFPLRLVGTNQELWSSPVGGGGSRDSRRNYRSLHTSILEGHIEVFGKKAIVELSGFGMTNNVGSGLIVAGGAVVKASHCRFAGCDNGVVVDPRLRGDSRFCGHYDCRDWAGCKMAPGRDEPSRVELISCDLSSNHGHHGGCGLDITNGYASVTNCHVEGNSRQGIMAHWGAQVDIYGEETIVKENKYCGLIANGGTIRIHLPPSHKTSYNNREGLDRVESNNESKIMNTVKEKEEKEEKDVSVVESESSGKGKNPAQEQMKC